MFRTIKMMMMGISLSLGIFYFTGIRIIRFSFLYVIPVGAILLGILSVSGYFKHLKHIGKKVEKTDYKKGFIIVIVVLLLIKAGEYALCRVDENQQVVVSVKGTHISQFETEEYGRMHFFNYLRMDIEQSEFSYKTRYGKRNEFTIPVLKYLAATWRIGAFCLGMLICGLGRSGDPYCENCKRYKEKKSILSATLVGYEEVIQRIRSLAERNDDGIELYNYMKNYPYQLTLNSKEGLNGTACFCRQCKAAEINFDLSKKDEEGSIETNYNFKKTIKLPYSVIEFYENEESKSGI